MTFIPLSVLLPAFVLFFGILAVAIYEHVTSLSLSLPIAPTLTALTIALPLVAVTNAIYFGLSRQRQNQPRLLPPGRTQRLLWTNVQYGTVQLPGLPIILQALQAIVVVATSTLLIVNNLAGGASTSSLPSPLLRCALETTWQRLFSAHDAAALRRIQDALDCCGFNSVADRAWPFASGSGGGGATCAASYGRTTPCRVPWMQTVQRRAGVELAVVVLVGLFQVLTLVAEWPSTAAATGRQEAHRPLLEDRVVERYTDDAEEANGHSEVDNDSSRPRVEPSGLQNEWTT